MVRRPSGTVAGEISHRRNRPLPAAPTNSPASATTSAAHQRGHRPARDRRCPRRACSPWRGAASLPDRHFLRPGPRSRCRRRRRPRSCPCADSSPYSLAGLVAVSATNCCRVDAPLPHAFGEQQRQPRLDAGHAVRDFWNGALRPSRSLPSGRRSGTGVVGREHAGTRRWRARARSLPGSPCRAAAGCTRTWRPPCRGRSRSSAVRNRYCGQVSP